MMHSRRVGTPSKRLRHIDFAETSPSNHGGDQQDRQHWASKLGTATLAIGHGSIVAIGRRNLRSLVAGRNERITAALVEMDGDLVRSTPCAIEEPERVTIR